MRIIQDAISNGLLILAVLIMLYFIFVVGMLDILIYPMLLLVGALVLRVFVNRKLLKDEEIDRTEQKTILVYYLLGLIGIGLGSWFVQGLYDFPIEKYVPSLVLSGSSFDIALFTVLMAIVEEQFFRGELLEWMSNTMTPTTATIGNAAVFMGYHLGVYGTNPDNLLYVFIGGLTLALITVKSRRLLPAQLAHITNNLWSVL